MCDSDGQDRISFVREVSRKIASFPARRHVIVGPEVHYSEESAGMLSACVMNKLNYEAANFPSLSLFLFICSTTGDGVPRKKAQPFHDTLSDVK